MNKDRILRTPGTRTMHVRRHANRLGKIGEPQCEVEQRITMLEKSSATCFGLSESPSLLRILELILSGSHAHDLSELATLQKSAKLLNIGAETMIVANDHHSSGFFGSGKYSLHAVRCE